MVRHYVIYICCSRSQFIFTAWIFLTWDVLLPHLSPQRSIMALSFFLIRTWRLMHAQEGQRQGHSCMALQHIRTVVADGVHGQCTWWLIYRLWELKRELMNKRQLKRAKLLFGSMRKLVQFWVSRWGKKMVHFLMSHPLFPSTSCWASVVVSPHCCLLLSDGANKY